MDLNEIRKKKIDMEIDIQAIVFSHIKKFTQETGMEVKGVRINMLDITSLSDDKTKYIMGDVEIELESI